MTKRRQVEDELKKRNGELQDELNHFKLKSGLVPVCASCKRVLTEKGWEIIQQYVALHSQAEFSNSICGECAKRLSRETAA